MPKRHDRVVVVGGGIAGVSTVSALRAGGYDGNLTLLDAGTFPYDRPPLSKEFLEGSKNLDQIALQPPGWYDDQSIDLRTETHVTAVLPTDGAVELQDGSLLHADRVVLATGGRAARPPIPGSDDDRVHVVRTAADADRLRVQLKNGARVLIVGAGLIGAEVASTAIGFGCSVSIVDPVAVPLAGALGHETAHWLHSIHKQRGIDTVTAGVESIKSAATGLEVHLNDGSGSLIVDVVVLGVGMIPETGLAEQAGLHVDRGIVVDPGQVTSNPAVLAVGDPTRIRTAGALAGRTEHWDAAEQSGRRAAATILGVTPPPSVAPWFWTDRHGLHIEAVGSMSGAEQVIRRGERSPSGFSVFGMTGKHVVGAVAVNDAATVRAARRMIDRAITVDPAHLADPSADLRKLLRG
ncbi:ferredoxin reductase [Rhodococcus sp. KBW08]|uniref:NAD(P)/FAD-dependent oxidoreductase n=1 Tax=Rhodococcus sp. KBW08 TaxID=2144188 RepID=UPI000F5B1DA1|nr:FAD-dependent oxidoreductase [Rhodococcus sp. KBW08]RQO46074.1 ferredoxin reductase [Rhodococcus sp. KBW08]